MNKRQFHKDKPFLCFYQLHKSCASYMQGQNYSASQSNLPVVCNLNSSWAVGKLCLHSSGKGESVTGMGKPIFWFLSQHCWFGNILTIQPIAGAQQVCRLLTPCKDDLNMSDEEKKPRDLANHSFPGCTCHILARVIHRSLMGLEWN